MDIYIRKADLKDLEQIHTLESQTQVSPWTLSSIKGDLENTFNCSFVLYADGRCCGYLLGSTPGDIFEIHTFGIDPDLRKQGLGFLLLSSAIDCVMSNGVSRAHLEVRKTNYAAISLYTKKGFTIDTVRKGYYSDGEDAILMSLVLKK